MPRRPCQVAGLFVAPGAVERLWFEVHEAREGRADGGIHLRHALLTSRASMRQQRLTTRRVAKSGPLVWVRPRRAARQVRFALTLKCGAIGKRAAIVISGQTENMARMMLAWLSGERRPQMAARVTAYVREPKCPWLPVFFGDPHLRTYLSLLYPYRTDLIQTSLRQKC